MRYRKTIAIILVTGMLIGALGGIIAWFVTNRQDVSKVENKVELPLEEKRTQVLLPGLSERPNHEQSYSPETAELGIDVGKIERETSPAIVGGTVRYETKEMLTNESP